MKKLRLFMFLLTCLFVLSLILSSCDKLTNKDKNGKIKVTNSSTYTEDDPVNMQLIKNDSSVLATNSIKRGNSITWTDVPSEVSIYIKATDKNGRVSSTYSFSLTLNETANFKYDGASISRVYE